MSDLLKRLEKRSNDPELNQFLRADYAEAADEIERLREEVATLRPTGLSRVWDDYCATVQLVTKFAAGNPNLSDRVGAALAEIERLRVELTAKTCFETGLEPLLEKVK